ncbi:MAG: hypothetical protein KBA71_08560 [Opitutaceae bacterium]|nr:hypothetical protein [Opitutaceae bacterium]
MNPQDKRSPWEDALDSALKGLPSRRAPATLEARVLAAIAGLEATPWWRKGFAFWPPVMRVVFLIVTLGIATGTVWALLHGGSGASMAALGDWMGSVFRGWSRAQSVAADLFRHVIDSLSPTAQLWILTGIGLVALCYATLIGTGAALYRIFMRPQ